MWLLLILDLLVALFITLAHFNILFSVYLLSASATYLLIKVLAFRGIMSVMDLLIGIYIILMIMFDFTSIFYYIAMGWFLYKLILTVIG